jgi:1,2-diacylglycerol 3-beta-galactosyltransferase
VPAENVRVTGLPVANRFYQPLGDRRELRQRLGWPQDLPVILLVGGGEGMGPLGKIALAISEANLPASLVIVAGRNEKLRSQLAAMSWKQPTFIYGFVRNMPDMMAAANILVTKAGPGTITEALNVGLPMILYSRLPGQEDGNVMFVTEEGAGFWAPEPQQVVQAINNWLQNPAKLAEVAGICNRLARPDAARQIAHILVEQIGVNK